RTTTRISRTNRTIRISRTSRIIRITSNGKAADFKFKVSRFFLTKRTQKVILVSSFKMMI
ncbi:MAG: hypothetical protein IKU65_06500, partial [Oscillospiraceae bacterium]|nr:hypothetical protein [Oscillospiraceae bacterium]